MPNKKSVGLNNESTFSKLLKEMPLGMKIIAIYFGVAILLSLRGLYADTTGSAFLLGFPFKYPTSLLVNLVPLLIPVFILISIYKKKWWKFVLGLLTFNLINSVANTVWMLINPFTKILEVTTGEIPDVSPEILERVALTTKITVSISLLIGLIISLIIIIYIFKNKEYFNKGNSTKRII